MDFGFDLLPLSWAGMEYLNFSLFLSLVRALGMIVRLVANSTSWVTSTHRDRNVVFLVTCVQLPTEPDDGVSLVFMACQKHIILRLIQNWLTTLAVDRNVSILQKYIRKEKKLLQNFVCSLLHRRQNCLLINHKKGERIFAYEHKIKIIFC